LPAASPVGRGWSKGGGVAGYQSHGSEEPQHGYGGATHTKLGHDDVKEGTNHDHKIKVVPGVLDIFTDTKAGQLEDELEGEEDGEDKVHDVKELCVGVGLGREMLEVIEGL
jgi:hypothetical protein